MEDGLTQIQNLRGNGLLFGNDIENELDAGTLSKEELLQIVAGYLEKERTKLATDISSNYSGLESAEFNQREQRLREESDRLNKMTKEELNSWVKENLGTDFSKLSKTEQNFAMKAYAERGDNQYVYGKEETYVRPKNEEERTISAEYNEESFWKEQTEYAKMANNKRNEGEYVIISPIEKEKKKALKNYGVEITGAPTTDYLNEVKKAITENRKEFKRRMDESWKSMNLADSATSQYYAGQGLSASYFYGNQLNAAGMIAETEIYETIRKQNDLIEKQNILKKAGIEATEENLEIFKQEIAIEQDRLKKQQQMKQISAGSNTLMNAQDKVMRMRGQNRQADLLKLEREQIALQGGKPLSQEQINEFNSRLDLENLLNKEIDTTIKDNLILTNDLTSRGGMVGGAYVQDNFQSKILEKISLMNSIEQAITRQAQNVATLQKNVQTIVGNLQGY